jgi:predicted transcriptional regulator YdeE
MRKIIVIVASVLLLIGFIAYLALGGLRKPEITTVQVSDYILAGVPFKGMASNEELLKLFEETRTYYEGNSLPGTLAAVYYDIQSSEKGEVDTYVGVMVKDSSATLPKKYTYRRIPAAKAVQATITTHYLVAPSPEKIRATLLNYAQERGLALQNLVIEQYLADSHIIIEIPVQN